MLHLVCWPARTGRVLSALIAVISSLSAQTALASLPTAPGGSSPAQPQAPEEARHPALARVETETGPQGTTRRTYDSAGRLTRASYPNGQVIDYGYDAAGRKTTLTTAGRITKYGYDELNRLVSVTDHTGTTRYTYDALGRQTEVRYPNGTVTTTEYDRLSRPILVETRDASGNIIARSAYTLDKAGHRTKVVELDTATCAGAVPCTATRTVDYVYDPLYRLVSETVTDASGIKSTTWTYDRVGNRLREDANGVITAYTYDKNDRLLTETRNGLTTTYTYDKNGNTTSKVDPEGSVTYTWNQDNRLIAASDGTQNLTFSYDASGIRQSRTVNGVTTDFLVDPNQPYAQVLAEYQGDAEEVYYTYGDDLLSQTWPGGTSYYHYDALGSTRALTGAAGSLTDAYAYKAFGEVAAQRGGTPNAYLFAGEQFDQGLNAYFLRERYLDTSLGRFLSQDPFRGLAAEPATLHDYVYAASDPLLYTDRSGSFFLLDVLNGEGFRSSLRAEAGMNVGRTYGPRFAKEMGRVLEKRLEDAIRECLKPGAALKRGKVVNDHNGQTRILDFLLESEKSSVNFETKFRLPAGSVSESFKRATNQAQAAIDSGVEAFVVGVFPSGLKSDKRATDFLSALNGDKGLIHVVDGFAGFMGVISEFLIDECL